MNQDKSPIPIETGFQEPDVSVPTEHVLPQHGVQVRGPRWLTWGGFLHEGHLGEPYWDGLQGFHLLRMEAHGPFEDAEEAHGLARLRMEAHPRLRLQVLDVPHDEVDVKALVLFMRVMEGMGARVDARTGKGILNLHVLGWSGEPWHLPSRIDWACWTVLVSTIESSV